jgi:hypothetical protein
MELPIFHTYMNFSRHHICCFTIISLFVLDKSMAWNRCLQHPCFKNLCKIAQASKNSDSNTQHFLSDLLTYSWFHSMLFALPDYQFPFTVMNRCLYLIYKWIGLVCWERILLKLQFGSFDITSRFKFFSFLLNERWPGCKCQVNTTETGI